MTGNIEHNGRRFSFDFQQPQDISIPLREGAENPNCYYADPVVFDTIRSGDFVGSVKEGGNVNYQSIRITPHGNGTHTECYGHLSPEPGATLNRCLTRFHFVAQLVSVAPTTTQNGDEVVLFENFESVFSKGVEAVIIRTLPNEPEKQQRQYSGTNPPYLDPKITSFLRDQEVRHLLIDLPSVDKEIDLGALSAHRAFWNLNESVRKNSTITELAYIDNEIQDGLYLLNLQITSLEADASPSKPVLFKLTEC